MWRILIWNLSAFIEHLSFRKVGFRKTFVIMYVSYRKFGITLMLLFKHFTIKKLKQCLSINDGEFST